MNLIRKKNVNRDIASKKTNEVLDIKYIGLDEKNLEANTILKSLKNKALLKSGR